MERWFFMLLTTLYVSFLVAGCGGGHGRTTSQPKAMSQPPGNIAEKKAFAETQVFGQMVKYALPEGFVPVFAKTVGSSYIQESVLQGESTEKWSQMITLSGSKGVSRIPHMTPKAFADMISGGFQKSCPDSFARSETGAQKISDRDAFITTVSCGIADPAGELHSESVLLIVIAGESDYYTIQWAERGAVSRFPMNLQDQKWTDRFQQLLPIELLPPKPDGFYMFGYK